MKTLPFSRIRNVVIILALVILAGGLGYRLGEKKQLSSEGSSRVTSVSNTAKPSSVSADFALFWDVWQKMNGNFFDAKKLDARQMLYGAISGMVASADDPYTSFFPPKENKEFKQDIGGEFEGIGAQLDLKDGRIIILSPLKDSPAEEAGLLPGDYILEVNGEDTRGWTLEQAVTNIRGPKNSKVVLTVLHPNATEPTDIEVTRNTILVPSVEHWVKPINEIAEIKEASESASFRTSTDQIAYIKLSRFGDHTTEDWTKAVQEIVNKAESEGVKGLVFDMRYNPGGYLDGAVFIASEFLNSGTVVSQKNSDGTESKLNVNRKGSLTNIPMVVLVNKGSASAAEIVAGALKDYGRAQIVGETTFGKGSVQTPFELKEGASVHITTGKWFLPKGDSIAEKGITPDVEIIGTPSETQDAQLSKAIELLLQQN